MERCSGILIVSGYFCLQSTSCSPASIKALHTHIIVWCVEKLYSKFQCVFPNIDLHYYTAVLSTFATYEHTSMKPQCTIVINCGYLNLVHGRPSAVVLSSGVLQY